MKPPEGAEMTEHLENIASAVGRVVVRGMQDILGLPDESRAQATHKITIKTVDGHVWTIAVEWGGFEGSGRLK